MELGVSMFADLSIDPSTGIRKKPGQRLQELIEEIKLADEVGLDVFGIGEHHRDDYAVSNPEIILAAAAPVTKNIKLGSAVTVLSSTDPVRAYQNFSTVDLISNGRAELMVGRGSFIESFPLFGYNLNDYERLFEEKLDLLLKINQNEQVSWSGTVRPPLKNQAIFPRPDQNLDIWIAVGGTPASIVRAAKLGLPLMIAIIGGSPAQFKPHVELYKSEYLKAGHDPAKMRIGIHSHTFIGENSDDIADRFYPYYAAQMNRIGRERGWPPSSRAQFDGSRSSHGALFVGDSSEIVDRILRVQEMFGLTRFVAHMDVGGPPHSDIMKAIELFGTKVAPEVKRSLSNA
jgi:probable LLM family oxidoreductase